MTDIVPEEVAYEDRQNRNSTRMIYGWNKKYLYKSWLWEEKWENGMCRIWSKKRKWLAFNFALMLPQPLNPIVFSLFRGYNKRFLFLSLFLLLFILIILSHISFLLLSSSYFSSFLLQSFSLLLSLFFSSPLFPLHSFPPHYYFPFLIIFLS